MHVYRSFQIVKISVRHTSISLLEYFACVFYCERAMFSLKEGGVERRRLPSLTPGTTLHGCLLALRLNRIEYKYANHERLIMFRTHQNFQ